MDRSITGPGEFITTNVVGTFSLLQAALVYWSGLAAAAKTAFRLLHISTDEIFGSLGGGRPVQRNDALLPRAVGSLVTPQAG